MRDGRASATVHLLGSEQEEYGVQVMTKKKRAGKPTMPVEDAENVLATMRADLRDRYDNNVSEYARALGRSQSGLSKNIEGVATPSIALAEDVARLHGITEYELRKGVALIDIVSPLDVALRYWQNKWPATVVAIARDLAKKETRTPQEWSQRMDEIVAVASARPTKKPR